MCALFSSSNEINVHNTTQEMFYVVPMPDKTLKLADTALDIAMAVAQLVKCGIAFKSKFDDYLNAAKAAYQRDTVDLLLRTEWSNAEIVAALFQSVLKDGKITTWEGLVRTFSGCKAIGKVVQKSYKPIKLTIEGVDVALETLDTASQQCLEKIKKLAYTVRPNETRKVSRTSVWSNPGVFSTVKGWVGGVFGGSDMVLYLIGSESGRLVEFGSNSDQSWIIRENDVVRAKYGSTETADAGAGYYRIAKYPFPYLPPRLELKAGESIGSGDGDYDLVFQDDGNLVLNKRDRPKGDKVLWSTKTNGKAAGGRFTLQEDGNLVIYDQSGKVVLALNDYGNDEKHTARQLWVQDDGNLVLKAGSDVVWDTMHRASRFQL
jgi:hypothetical protein